MLLTRVDKPGFFVEDDFTMASQGSDYSQLRNGRVIDKTLRIADQFLVDLVHSDYALAPDGTLAEHEAMRIQNYVEQALRNGIVAAGNATNVEFRLNRFENIASTRTLRCTTRVQVRASAKWIEHDIAFASTLGQ